MSTIGAGPLPVSGVAGSSLRRGAPSRSAASQTGTALLSPPSIAGEPAPRRVLSSMVPGTLSAPFASVNFGSFSMQRELLGVRRVLAGDRLEQAHDGRVRRRPLRVLGAAVDLLAGWVRRTRGV